MDNKIAGRTGVKDSPVADSTPAPGGRGECDSGISGGRPAARSSKTHALASIGIARQLCARPGIGKAFRRKAHINGAWVGVRCCSQNVVGG